MQSEPHAPSNQTSSTHAPPEPPTSSNHGSQSLQHEQQPLLRLGSSSAESGHGAPRDRRVASSRSTSRSCSSSSDHDAIRSRLSRLSPQSTRSDSERPSYRQIEEYENALSPSPVRSQREDALFIVVPSTPKSTRDRVILDDLPNEVLTHILSHLPPAAITSMSLVSRRLNNLVTTPHAWRIAFSRFFAGRRAIVDSGLAANADEPDQFLLDQRVFTRLTALASWRSEYILRTRLLRSLARGKPSQIAPGHGASSRSNSAANNANAVVTYTSQLVSIVNHIDAVWDVGKKSPRFIHGTDESGQACTSDPNIGKIDSWGLNDPQTMLQFAELNVGHELFGLDDGPTGVPNVMAISQPHGMLYGLGSPGGAAYYRATDEQRGRFLRVSVDVSEPAHGIPRVPDQIDAISAVWLAKSKNIPTMTEGMIGILTGSTLGIVTAHSIGSDDRAVRLARGQCTARWVLSPGVPIIAIVVDEKYNSQRTEAKRIWAVALNALGECFYLQDSVHTNPAVTPSADINTHAHRAWLNGRTVYWHLVESTRRTERHDPYSERDAMGSYSPRSSASHMRLSKEQLTAETREIEAFLNFRPSHFRKICIGWDMQRKLGVDFAGDDGSGAGESILVIGCGLQEGTTVSIRRYTRSKNKDLSKAMFPVPKTPPSLPANPSMGSLFGGSKAASLSLRSVNKILDERTAEVEAAKDGDVTYCEEWYTTDLAVDGLGAATITAICMDGSEHATTTLAEDPLQTGNGTTHLDDHARSSSGAEVSHIPGNRARFFAVGSSTGMINIFDVRGPQSQNPALINSLQPQRIIATDSPQITCLALSALILVHGGNDGLVQAWDVLASTTQAVRTLNSRFSSRARRRLIQAEASIHGVGMNLYAAGGIVLDPNPTILRGMVSLGTHLRYWSYSSSTLDQHQSRKRRVRRSTHRGSNAVPERHASGGKLKDYIANEQEELRQEKERRAKHEAHLQGRFGVGLGGLSDDEALRYAQMVSAETYREEEQKRRSDSDTSPLSARSAWTSQATVTTVADLSFRTDMFEHDLEKAMRLSLAEGVNEHGHSPRAGVASGFDVPITYKQRKARRSPSASPPASRSASSAQPVPTLVEDDFEFALQLSAAEEESRVLSRDTEHGSA